MLLLFTELQRALIAGHDTAVLGAVWTQGKKAVSQSVYSQGGRQKADENRHNVG